jgi:hypothetical protein
VGLAHALVPRLRIRWATTGGGGGAGAGALEEGSERREVTEGKEGKELTKGRGAQRASRKKQQVGNSGNFFPSFLPSFSFLAGEQRCSDVRVQLIF